LATRPAPHESRRKLQGATPSATSCRGSPTGSTRGRGTSAATRSCWARARPFASASA